MTEQEVIRANQLNNKIRDMENFIRDIECNYEVCILDRIVKKRHRHQLGVIISDYMRPYHYYELTNEQRKKFANMLKEELQEYKAELENI